MTSSSTIRLIRYVPDRLTNTELLHVIQEYGTENDTIALVRSLENDAEIVISIILDRKTT